MHLHVHTRRNSCYFSRQTPNRNSDQSIQAFFIASWEKYSNCKSCLDRSEFNPVSPAASSLSSLSHLRARDDAVVSLTKLLPSLNSHSQAFTNVLLLLLFKMAVGKSTLRCISVRTQCHKTSGASFYVGFKQLVQNC